MTFLEFLRILAELIPIPSERANAKALLDELERQNAFSNVVAGTKELHAHQWEWIPPEIPASTRVEIPGYYKCRDCGKLK